MNKKIKYVMSYLFICLTVIILTNANYANADLYGWLQGTITDANTNEAIGGALITTDDQYSDISKPNGMYQIYKNPGIFTVTVEASGYQPLSYYDISIHEFNTVTLNFELTPVECQCDFYEDGIVNYLELGLFADHWLLQCDDPGWNPKYDIVEDCIINFLELGIFADNWLEAQCLGITFPSGNGPNFSAGCALDMDYSTRDYSGISSKDIDSTSMAEAEDEIWVAVVALGVSNLDTYQAEVNFDPARMAFIGGYQDNSMDGITNLLKINGGTTIGFQAVERVSGTVNISNALSKNDTNEAPEGSGIIALLNFKVLDSEPNNLLTLSNVHYLDSERAGNSIVSYMNAVISISDNTPPTAPSLNSSDRDINTWSNDNTITILWNAGLDQQSGVAGYSYVIDNSAVTEPDNNVDTIQTQFTSEILSDRKNYYFHVCTVDNADNTSVTLHIGPFYIDTTPPAGGSISVNNDAESTDTEEVVLTLSANDVGCGMGQIQFSNDNDYWSDPIDYATSANWSLLPGEGKRTVYVRFSDAIGNWTDYDISDDIEINTNSPGRLILVAGGGAAQTNDLWPTTQELAISAYRIFYSRGFRDMDIYFMGRIHSLGELFVN